MEFVDLREWIDRLESDGDLKRVSAAVDWNLEMGGIARTVMNKYGPGLLFENLKGYNKKKSRCKKLATATMSAPRRLSYMLGLPRDISMGEMIKELKEKFKERIKPMLLNTGPVKENILKGKEINLYDFPAPIWHNKDGGRYFHTSCVVITKDPQTGGINLGTYRGMILDKNRIGVYLSPQQHWGIHYQKYIEMGEPMPVAVAIGLDPAVRFVGSVPFSYDVREYDVAGALRKAPVQLVKCETVDLEVPANAEIVVEGTISPDPESWAMEGPMGEYTGYYGGVASLKPVIEVTCLSHRNDPIFESVCEGWGPGHPNESGVMLELSGSALLWNALDQAGVPGVLDVYTLPASRITTVAVKIHKTYFGQAKQVAAVLWGCPLLYWAKHVMVVDDDIDIHDFEALEWAFAYRVNPDPTGNDLVVYPGTMGSAIDPSVPVKERRILGKTMAKWNRLLIDATKNWELEPQEQYGGDIYPPVSFEISPETQKLIDSRWSEYKIDL